jgi:hypothetical protein
VSAGDLYGNDRERHALKRIRRERLRPIRALIGQHRLPCSIHLGDYDSEAVRIVAGTFESFDVDLREPLDHQALCEWLHEQLDTKQGWLDDRRARVLAAEEAPHEAE